MRCDKPVVVVSAHTMGLAVVRALGEAGVPVYVLHHDARDFAHRSRYVRGEWVIPPPRREEQAFIDAIVRHADRLSGAMLVPTSDDAVAAVSRHKPALARHYVVACPDWAVTRNVIEKSRTYALAAWAGVATPKTVTPASLEAAVEGGARIGYPLVLKPSQSHLFYARFGSKLVVVRDEPELTRHWRAARDAGLDVVLQELVPGPDSAVVNYNAYTWGDGPGVEFTARQLRKAPPHLGSPRVVVSERIDEVLEAGRSTLGALGFEGFACTELKRDERDGRYKVLDVNGRHNLSGLLAVRCGINFPLLQYRHLMYGELPERRDFEPGVCWTDFFRDAGYGLRYLLEERLSPWEHLAPYLGRGCDAVFDRADLRPFVGRGRSLAASALGRFRGAVRPLNEPAPEPERKPGWNSGTDSGLESIEHRAQSATPSAAPAVSRR